MAMLVQLLPQLLQLRLLIAVDSEGMSGSGLTGGGQLRCK